MSDRDERDAVTLAGLRRLVLHSRGLLQTTTGHAWPKGAHVTSEQANNLMRAQIAATLAVEVLTLVADCLPPGVDVPALQTELAEAAEARDAYDEQLGEFMSVAERAGCDDATDPGELERLIDDLKSERRSLLDEREQRQAAEK